MIQANELRIGNLIKFSDCVYTRNASSKNLQNELDNGVDAIGISRIQEIRSYEVLTNGKLYTFNNIDPVPLTDEILIKCGFSKNENTYYHELFICNNGTLRILADNYRTTGKDVKIKSLHQLQNLYFALTGKELDLNI